MIYLSKEITGNNFHSTRTSLQTAKQLKFCQKRNWSMSKQYGCLKRTQKISQLKAGCFMVQFKILDLPHQDTPVK